MAKAVRYRKSPRQGKFVSITMFRALESEVFHMRDTMEAVRHDVVRQPATLRGASM